MSKMKVNRIENTSTTAGGIDINTSGDVGIGTSSPAQKLVVDGNIQLGTSSGSGKLYLSSSTGFSPRLEENSNALSVLTSNNERMRIDSSGRLLINNTASASTHPLQVTAKSDANAICIIGRSSDDIGEITWFENDRTTSLGEIQYRQDHVNFRHRVGDIRFATGGTTERMRIDSSGNVLIGSTNNFTNSKLAVRGSLGFSNTSFACVEQGEGKNGSFTSIVFDYFISSGPSSTLFETQAYGYNNDFVDHLVGAYGGGAQTIRNNNSSGMSVALSFPGGSVTHRITISGSITHPVAKVKATCGGLASNIELLSITFS